MTKTIYNVHIYREMRLYFPCIAADTPEQAATIAGEKMAAEAECTEDCDGENLAALIDVAGDDQHAHSVRLDFEPERMRKSAATLLNALTSLAEQADKDCPTDSRSRAFTDAIAQARASVAKVYIETFDRRRS